MSDSVQPHRRQPIRLPRPWDSPGKNTGVGCHFLLQYMKVKSEIEVTQSCLTVATPWTEAYQAPLSMGFSRQEHWSGLPCPPPRDLPDPETEPRSPVLQADSLPFEPQGKVNRHNCSNKALFTKTGSKPDLTHWPWFPDPCSTHT